MQHPSQFLLAQTNKAIKNYNAHDYHAAYSNIEEFLETFQNPSFDSHQAIYSMKRLRIIASQIRAGNLVVEIDRFLQAFMGAGIPHGSVSRDRQIRAKANQAIEAWNNDNHDRARSLLGDWILLCQSEPGVSFEQEDCFPPLLGIAHALGDASIFQKITTLYKSVTAQSVVMESNKRMMSCVAFDAIDYPHTVTIETYMKCNARCTFCPYPDMETNSQRAGLRMSDGLFEKIIADLTDIPSDWLFEMNLSRVNEPLLDHRLFDFIGIIERNLPQVGVFLPSNGSTLTEKNIRRLADHNNFQKLMVSLNTYEKDDYERTMGISFDRTIANLDRLHAMRKAGEIPFAVLLTAVMEDGPKLDAFGAWCKERYPLFHSDSYPPTDWFGMSANENVDNITMPNACKDWYQVHILADGSEAQCCYDADGKFGDGNVGEMHILEIYNKDWQRRLRRFGATRQSELAPDFCRSCTYG